MKFRISRVVPVCISLIFIGLIFISQSIAEIDPKTIQGLWLFDAKDTLKDYSDNNFDGKQFGNPKTVDGKFGKALEFDGTSYVEIPDHKNPTKAITITAWVKSAAATWNDHGWIVEKRDAYILHPNGGTTNVSFCVANGAPWNLPNAWDTGAASPKDQDITEWHMYTCTFDSATGEWNIYIDGEVQSNLKLNKAEIVEEIGPVHIGWDECCGGTRFGKGTIDEVAIFDVALSRDDIQSIMNKGFLMALAVESADKLATTWADIKTHR